MKKIVFDNKGVYVMLFCLSFMQLRSQNIIHVARKESLDETILQVLFCDFTAHQISMVS